MFVQFLLCIVLLLGLYIAFQTNEIEYFGIYLSIASASAIFILNVIYFICMAKIKRREDEQDQLETLIKQSRNAVNILSPYPPEIVYRPTEQFDLR